MESLEYRIVNVIQMYIKFVSNEFKHNRNTNFSSLFLQLLHSLLFKNFHKNNKTYSFSMHLFTIISLVNKFESYS